MAADGCVKAEELVVVAIEAGAVEEFLIRRNNSLGNFINEVHVQLTLGIVPLLISPDESLP